MDKNLALRLEAVGRQRDFPPRLLARMGQWIDSSPDEELFRINVLRWAEKHGVGEDEALDLFLHAAKAGIFDLSWGVVCSICAVLITTPGGLRSLGPTSACRL